MGKRRGNQTSFKPGVSGNPGGRPRVSPEVIGYAREKSVDMLKVLESIALNPGEEAAERIKAATEFYDRAWGRPAQQVDLGLSNVSDAELAEKLPEAMAILAEAKAQ